ncbi:MAG: MerR family transcriptional regulator [Emergencia timonensis]|uniref:MerR family transcriptional regulator n=1 Tax=Emergencia timonensis TaxID=1776384 RepID=UPI00083251A9|nr:MerR family transcriptional regulator [Emergencia timonensis]WNX87763.1 MerR family transcriptional regulator [Emergencia timonensis]
MLKIGDFSKLSKISIYMLRHYDKLGLLVPAHIDEDSGYRYYEEKQLTIANRIQALKAMGLGLNEIKDVIYQYRDNQSLADFLKIETAKKRKLAEELQRQIRQLETTITALQQREGILRYSIEIKEVPKRLVMCTRDRIPAYHHEGQLWRRLAEVQEGQGLTPASLSYHMAIFHDGGFVTKDVDVEVQIAVLQRGCDTEIVKFKEVEPFLAAVLTYEGRYELITQINETIANWVHDNGYEFCGPHFNIYHVSPQTEADADKMVTEVGFPVKKVLNE